MPVRPGAGHAPPHARPDPPPRLFSSNRFTLDPERARRIGSSDTAVGGGSNNDVRLLDSEGGGDGEKESEECSHR
jgi:hypothetical protein